jgi:inosose dehydratase
MDVRFGNAPISWGVSEFDIGEDRKIQPATVLDEMRLAGYVGTELGDYGFLPTDVGQLGREIQARNFELIGGFCAYELSKCDDPVYPLIYPLLI